MIVAGDDLEVDEAAAVRRVVILQNPKSTKRDCSRRIAHELPNLHFREQGSCNCAVRPFLVRRRGLRIAVEEERGVRDEVRALVDYVRNLLRRHVPQSWDARSGGQDIFDGVQVSRG